MKLFKLITLLLLPLASVSIFAQSETANAEIVTVRAEVERLTEQNAELIAMLKKQIGLYEQQQEVVANLSDRIASLESQSSAESASDHSDAIDLDSLAIDANELNEFSLEDMNDESAPLDEPKITFGGWAGFAYMDDDREGTNPTFDAHPLYLYTKAKPLDDWTFFAEIEIEHLFKSSSSGTKGELKMERLYIEHEFSDSSRVRAGKFFLPFGYWYNLHWHFLTETLSRPITFNNAYVPRQQVGIEYLNTTSIGNTHLNYYGWLGNGPDVFATDKRSESDFSMGAAIFTETILDNGVEIGSTFGIHQQKVDFDTELNAVIGGKVSAGDIELRGEFYIHDREIENDLESGYLSAEYKTSDTFGFVYRIDYGDDLKGSKSSLDPSTASNSFGFIWRPKPQLLFKGEYRFNSYKSPDANEDFNNWNFFSAIKF